jgi:hypothetical protein
VTGLVQNAKTRATTRASERVDDDDNVQRTYGYCAGCVNSSCRLRVCFAGVSEDVRDVSAILTRDVVRATSHSGALGGVGEDASRDVARGRA